MLMILCVNEIYANDDLGKWYVMLMILNANYDLCKW